MKTWQQRIRDYHHKTPEQPEVFVQSMELELFMLNIIEQRINEADYRDTRKSLTALIQPLLTAEKALNALRPQTRELLFHWVSLDSTSASGDIEDDFGKLERKIGRWRERLELICRDLNSVGRFSGRNNPTTLAQRNYTRNIIFNYQLAFSLDTPPTLQNRTFSAIFKALLEEVELDPKSSSHHYRQALHTPVI